MNEIAQKCRKENEIAKILTFFAREHKYPCKEEMKKID